MSIIQLTTILHVKNQSNFDQCTLPYIKLKDFPRPVPKPFSGIFLEVEKMSTNSKHFLAGEGTLYSL